MQPISEPTDHLPRVSPEAIAGHRELLHDELVALYGHPAGDIAAERLLALLAEQPRLPGRRALTERDVVAIAYPDHLRSAGATPLATLAAFAAERLDGLVSAIHLLPIHPYSSDDGFAVTDCGTVDPRHGSWDDIAALSRRFRLMLDLVVNHVSAEHPWFRAFLRGEQPYADWFVVPAPHDDLRDVRRPRATPLLTTFDTATGPQDVWTTFGPDQVDLDYRRPDVLLAAIRVLLSYVRHSAYFVRLDAVGFVWKQPGTECIHLEGTHAVIRILRAVLDVVAPDVRLVAETNVPHDENITYLGGGRREAQLVYNFALPPLLVHTVHTGDATTLSSWASELRTPVPSAMFLNFTASHDGIGMTPVTAVLAADERAALVRRVVGHGGLVSHRQLPDGGLEPYELNIAYVDALTAPDEPMERRVARLVVTQAIMLALKGVPAVYLPTLLGVPSWIDGVAQKGHPRAINRRKLRLGGDGDDVFDAAALDDPRTETGLTFLRVSALLRARRSTAAFDPRSLQRVLDHGPQVFALERTTPDGSASVLALHEVRGEQRDLRLPPGRWRDLVTGEDHADAMTLPGYGVAWLAAA